MVLLIGKGDSVSGIQANNADNGFLRRNPQNLGGIRIGFHRTGGKQVYCNGAVGIFQHLAKTAKIVIMQENRLGKSRIGSPGSRLQNFLLTKAFQSQLKLLFRKASLPKKEFSGGKSPPDSAPACSKASYKI